MMKKRVTLSVMAALGALACGGETGTLRVSVSGEEAAVDGWPVGDIGFVDGWSMRFETLVVNVGGFELHGADGEHADASVGDVLVDLTGGEREIYTLEAVGARRWEDVRYFIRAPTAASVDVGTVDPAVRQRMIAEGFSIYLEATATRGDETRTLGWGIDQSVLNRECIAGDETVGVVVPAGAIADAQVTLHWDHLFFDSLVLDVAEMRFDAMAAVADTEGAVTLEALRGQRIADLRDAAGMPLLDAMGEPVVYDPGSAVLEEPTLLHHMLAAATTVGHWNGEGHCHYELQP